MSAPLTERDINDVAEELGCDTNALRAAVRRGDVAWWTPDPVAAKKPRPLPAPLEPRIKRPR